jgi:hypothetical protein
MAKTAMEALLYERSMLHSTARALVSGHPDPVIHNALVESFVIHARLLIEFLYYDKKKSDDIRPEDWLDQKEWKEIREEWKKTCGEQVNSLLRKTYECANKYLAHLTTTRLDQKKSWDCPAILEGIEALLTKFLQQVEQTKTKNT